MDPRRGLPSVNAVLDIRGVAALLATIPRAQVVNAARDAVDRARRDPESAPAGEDAWTAAVSEALDDARQPSLRPLLNGTGVILHTNLGRAPLADAAIDAVGAIASGYCNLEYDVASGARGSRYVHCASLLARLTGAEDALVVNNNAAALVLALNTFADNRECIVSRGELVEIGGSFRVPEIMTRSGTRLVEVGTTNRTNIDDYRRAIRPETGAIAKVHRSNFAMVGFVAEVDGRALAALGRECEVPVIHDLGSGLLLPLDAYGLHGEPTARDAVDSGASVVTMSGDKLLGGPQAGIILGSRETIATIRQNPLTRAYRVDKMTLAALEATLSLYQNPTGALRDIPVLAQLTAPCAALRARADQIVGALLTGDRISVVDSDATVGGGAFPSTTLPSVALLIDGDAVSLERSLRTGTPGIITRIHDDAVLIDLRTILPANDAQLVQALSVALA